MSSSILFFFFFCLLTKIYCQVYTKAVQSNFPFVNGRIYIVHNGNKQLDTIMVAYERSTILVANGVTLGIRALEVVQEECNKQDLKFQIISISQTSFEMYSQISFRHDVNYTKIILDYFVSSSLEISTGMITSFYGFVVQSTWTQIQFTYYNPAISNAVPSNYFYFFITGMVIWFKENKFNNIMHRNIINNAETQVTIMFTSSVDLEYISVSYFAYSQLSLESNFLNYEFGVTLFMIYNTGMQHNLSQIPFMNLFLTFTTISSASTKKLDFSAEYQKEFDHISMTFETIHFKPQSVIKQYQNSNPLLTIHFFGFYFQKINCLSSSSYPVILSKSQLCFDACPVGTYDAGSNQCRFCTSFLPGCDQCTNSGCTKCNEDGNFFLFLQYCYDCFSNEFYNTTSYTCQGYCSSIFPSCVKCSINAQQCLQCYGQTFIQNGQCVCPLGKIYDLLTQQCESCNRVANCASCSSSGGSITCITCESNFQLVGNICEECEFNESYNANLFICEACNIIDNCSSCFHNAGIMICISCLSNSELSGNICSQCASNTFYDGISSCISCPFECLRCNNNTDCLQCRSDIGIILQLIDGICEQKQENDYNLSEIQCFIERFNNQNNQCQSSKFIDNMFLGFTYAASIPTINIVSISIGSFFGFLDDLSYYNYHQRNYSRTISVYFGELQNFTLARWIPAQITAIYKKLDFTYADKIMNQDLGKSPPDFLKTDGDIYFLKNTEKFWTSTLPFSLIIFLILSFVHWFSNKFVYKNSLLERFNYFGMLIVALVGNNIQYLSFKCTQQLFQILPLGPIYYVNIVFCYFVCLIVIVYAIGSVFVFQTLYSYLKKQYVLEQLFGSYWMARFIIYNLLKFTTGFIHAYFYYQQKTQALLLLISFSFKAILFITSVRKNKQKLQYIVDMINLVMLVFLQGFLLYQLFLISNDNYSSKIQSQFGLIQTAIILFVIFSKLSILIFITLQQIITSILFLFFSTPTPKTKPSINSIQQPIKFLTVQPLNNTPLQESTNIIMKSKQNNNNNNRNKIFQNQDI